jgi:glycosyltransferase involved in cell wall biosynthesis
LADGQTGFLVPWSDIDQYAARIDQLLQDKPLARRLGENGLKFVTERYDFEGYIGDLETMFARVIRESGSKAA